MVRKLRSWAYGLPKTQSLGKTWTLTYSCSSPKFGSNLVGRRRQSFHLWCFAIYTYIVLSITPSVSGNVINVSTKHSTIAKPCQFFIESVLFGDDSGWLHMTVCQIIAYDGQFCFLPQGACRRNLSEKWWPVRDGLALPYACDLGVKKLWANNIIIILILHASGLRQSYDLVLSEKC